MIARLWLTSVVLAAVVVTAQAQEPAPVFRVAVEAVHVDVLVRDGRRLVSGLTAADFVVEDRGVAQRIESITLEDAPFSVMLVLDASSSVRGPALTHLKQAVTAVVDLLRPTDRAALLTFSGSINLACDWTSDRTRLKQAIAGVTGDGATALYDAVHAALLLRDSVPARALILVFSDGEDSASWLPGGRVIDIVRRHDAVVYGVTARSGMRSALGYRVDFTSGPQPVREQFPPALIRQSLLSSAAEESGGAVVAVENTANLQESFVSILTEFRSRYVLTYSPQGVEAPGWHPLKVTLKGRGGQVTARRGYQR